MFGFCTSHNVPCFAWLGPVESAQAALARAKEKAHSTKKKRIRRDIEPPRMVLG